MATIRLGDADLSGVLSIPKDWYEAAEIDGAGVWARIKYITLPSMRNLIMLMLILPALRRRRISRDWRCWMADKATLTYAMVLCIAVMVFTMLYPIGMTMFNGLKSNQEINTFPPRFFPSEWHWNNFPKVGIHRSADVSEEYALIFGGNLLVTILVLGLAAFSISRIRVPYHRVIYFFILMTLFIPASSYMIPNFVNLKELGR